MSILDRRADACKYGMRESYELANEGIVLLFGMERFFIFLAEASGVHLKYSGFSRVRKPGKPWKSQGIFSDYVIFGTFVVFTLSLSVHMPDHFLGLSKAAGKYVKSQGNLI